MKEIFIDKFNELCIEQGIEYDDYEQYKEGLLAFASAYGFDVQVVDNEEALK